MTPAPPPFPHGWDPSRTATGNIGRPHRVEVGDRVVVLSSNLVGYVHDREGPRLVVGSAAWAFEVQAHVIDVAPVSEVWSLPPELVPS